MLTAAADGILAAAGGNGNGSGNGNGNGNGGAPSDVGQGQTHGGGQDVSTNQGRGASSEDESSNAASNDRARGPSNDGANGSAASTSGHGESENAASRGPRQADRSNASPPVVRSHDVTHTLRVDRQAGRNHLRWSLTDEQTLGFQIWRSNSPFVLIGTVGSATTAYEDDGAPADSKYKVTYFTGTDPESGYATSATSLDAMADWNPGVYVAAAAAPFIPAAEQLWKAAALSEGVLAGGAFLTILLFPTQIQSGILRTRSGLRRLFSRTRPSEAPEPSLLEAIAAIGPADGTTLDPDGVGHDEALEEPAPMGLPARPSSD